MKYLYWLAALIVIGVGVYFSTHFSIGPETITKIKFAQFSSPEELGKKVFEDLKAEVKAAPIVILGVTPNKIEDLELWRGFFEANQEKDSKYDVIVVESMLPYVEIFNTAMHVPVKEEMDRLVEGIRKAREQNLRVAVIVPSIYSSQLIKSNPVERLKEEYKLDVTSLTVAKFPVTRDQERTFEPKCIDSGEVDPAGTSALGCMIRNTARKSFRQKFEAGKFTGTMEQTGAKDFLILLNRN